jgi:hypothetical protein
MEPEEYIEMLNKILEEMNKEGYIKEPNEWVIWEDLLSNVHNLGDAFKMRII